MKKIILLIVLSLSAQNLSADQSCNGLPPIAPIPPIGCDYMIALCLDGQWTWVCANQGY
jgi:hypothetical protein